MNLFDDKLILVVSVLVGVLVLYNLYASYRCVKSEFSEPVQKLFQLLFVWVFPLFGALLVIHFAKPEEIKPNYKTSDAASSVANVEGWSSSSADSGGGSGGE